MAKVKVGTEYVKQSLVDLSKKLAAAVAFIQNKKGEITLEIPEPFDHPVRSHAPAIPKPCGVPPILEECSEIGTLMGILNAMPKPGRKVSKGKVKAKPSK